ncbi:MAG: radical SAM protein, partial [Candidatus Omnitrophica bacterium]|nr:radical SAM protein [Candidatus Omnitrophota bacterium]
MKGRVRFITLGCKVNQYETQAMRESLEKIGVYDLDGEEAGCPHDVSAETKFTQDADFVVINTCTVTKTADRENRYWIRRARRENPKARIIVTGCFAKRNFRELKALSDVDLILDNEEKADIAARLLGGDNFFASVESDEGRRAKKSNWPLMVSRSQGRSRAYIKIQDGCNHGCSFCKVVLVRGRSRSRPLADIRDEARRLRDAGYREIVLTGIQLGAYGRDLTPTLHLCDVLESCAKFDGLERIRLSAIEPVDVDDRLIGMLRGNSKCCPHFHIPLQSG